VDVARKAPAPAELRRFTSRFGAAALLDTEGRQYRDAGLAYMTMGEAEVIERLVADPRLLRLPLIRSGGLLAIGPDEVSWKALAATADR
jgi:arsenate reductase (glutaredoxin)